ncbi:arylamine N-acetyltransferase [Streptomyces sp. NPDC058045]|uniref:arylamine N-acetyltransferase family protein n=1 Tax=Streptomyces sp. NPDC058045 TaxID=3346311 RepID=UPI0036E4B4DB
MDTAHLTAYLRRLGVERPAEPTAAALGTLHLAHLHTVPFENLSVHLGEDIVLTDEALVAKVTDRQRGGFCYELGGAYAALLTALGYRVDLLPARVHGAGGHPGIPYGHLTLRVYGSTGHPWLSDIGFGSLSRHPLDLTALDTEQADPDGTFTLTPAADGELDLVRDGTPQYRFEPRPRALGDFRAGAWYHRTHPDSHFTHSLVCSRLTGTGRLTLSGTTLKETTGTGHTSTELTSDTEVLDCYRTRFNISLDRVPQVTPLRPTTA